MDSSVGFWERISTAFSREPGLFVSRSALNSRFRTVSSSIFPWKRSGWETSPANSTCPVTGFDQQIRWNIVPSYGVFGQNGVHRFFGFVRALTGRATVEVALQLEASRLRQFFVEKQGDLVLILFTGHTFVKYALSF